jgi:hypothetical protein
VIVCLRLKANFGAFFCLEMVIFFLLYVLCLFCYKGMANIWVWVEKYRLFTLGLFFVRRIFAEILLL